jgi:hypothetical protein
MKKIMLASACLLSLWAYPSNVLAEESTAITIYSSASPGAIHPNSRYGGANVPGYGMVRHMRNMNITQKESILKFTDVAALIDPTTVQFKSLTDPKGTKVAEQDYQFDLVSHEKLLEKYIDKKISIEKIVGDKTEVIEGTLLSMHGGMTLKTTDGTIKTVNGYSSVNFPDLPGGLMTKPTLVWNIITEKTGEHKTEVSYQTQGITWWADYNLTFKEGKDANSGTVDFSSWVSIINETGATFDKAKLKLIAGDVQRASRADVMEGRGMALAGAPPPSPSPTAPKFAEKAFFEYHMYTLNRPVTLPDNATKQMELVPAVIGVPVEKILVYTGVPQRYWNWGGVYYDRNYGLETGSKKVDVYLKLLNKEENGLGIPLPAGRIRVNQRDDDGSLEFIGESSINHTPRNEEVLVLLGSAFDVVGERKQLNYTMDATRKFADEEIEVRIRNQKKQPVKVKIVESMYRATGWTITSTSVEYTKDNAHQVSYLVTVPAEKEQVIRYTVHYTW